MTKKKSASRAALKPLAEGQVWRIADLRLQVGLVGKVLVHYKLAKLNAVRVPNAVASQKTIETYLKKNKAVLMRKPKAPSKKSH